MIQHQRLWNQWPVNYWEMKAVQIRKIMECDNTPVKLPYISCKNLAEVVHIRYYLQESCKNLRFQTNLSDSGRSDISCRVRRFLQDCCRSRHFLQDSWTDLARQCLKIERYSVRKCLECTENVEIVFSNKPILNQEYDENECECLIYGVYNIITNNEMKNNSKILRLLLRIDTSFYILLTICPKGRREANSWHNRLQFFISAES